MSSENEGEGHSNLVRMVDGVPLSLIEEVRAALSKVDQPFEPSLLFEAATRTKKHDETMRQSEFRAIDNATVWAACERLVNHVNSQDDEYAFALVRNDATQLRYRENGLFKEHQDYLSITSNGIEEYTLLLSLNTAAEAAAAEGGATIVYLEAGAKKAKRTANSGKEDGRFAFDTTAEGSCLLFRKDLDHEGELLKKGEKQLLSLNLLAHRKRSSQQVLLVDFPGEEERHERRDEEALLDAANSGSFAILVGDLSGMLAKHLEWTNRSTGEKKQPSVVRYSCPPEFSRDQFATVYKVMRRLHITEQAYADARAALDFFGPFSTSFLLVDLAIDTPKDEEEDERQVEDEERDPEVICCENEARTEVVAALAKELSLPYCRFKIVFAEGILMNGGDRGVDEPLTQVPLLPAWISMGDYDNIFSIYPLADFSRKRKSMREMLEHRGLGKAFYKGGNEAKMAEDPLEPSTPGEKVDYSDFPKYNHLADGICLALRAASAAAGCTAVPQILFPEYHDCLPKDLVYLPGCTASSSDDGRSLFHLDDEGRSCFTAAEALRASKQVTNIGLDNVVQRCLQRKRFDLPQQSSSVKAHFCNESVYGSLNVLSVTGLVRLAPATSSPETTQSSASPPEEFDAWPAENCRTTVEEALAARAELGSDSGEESS